MKSIQLNGRTCYVGEPATPATDCFVILHAKAMTSLEMANCVRWQRFTDAGIMVVFPESKVIGKWDVSEGSDDFLFLENLEPTLRGPYPNVERFHLAGFSNGAFMVGLQGMDAITVWNSYWLVCGTAQSAWKATGLYAEAGLLTMLLGTQDAILGGCIKSGEVMTAEDAQALYEAAGFTVNLLQFNGGHAWPGGIDLFPDPNWPRGDTSGDTSDATGLMIKYVEGL